MRSRDIFEALLKGAQRPRYNRQPRRETRRQGITESLRNLRQEQKTIRPLSDENVGELRAGIWSGNTGATAVVERPCRKTDDHKVDRQLT